MGARQRVAGAPRRHAARRHGLRPAQPGRGPAEPRLVLGRRAHPRALRHARVGWRRRPRALRQGARRFVRGAGGAIFFLFARALERARARARTAVLLRGPASANARACQYQRRLLRAPRLPSPLVRDETTNPGRRACERARACVGSSRFFFFGVARAELASTPSGRVSGAPASVRRAACGLVLCHTPQARTLPSARYELAGNGPGSG